MFCNQLLLEKTGTAPCSFVPCFRPTAASALIWEGNWSKGSIEKSRQELSLPSIWQTMSKLPDLSCLAEKSCVTDGHVIINKNRLLWFKTALSMISTLLFPRLLPRNAESTVHKIP